MAKSQTDDEKVIPEGCDDEKIIPEGLDEEKIIPEWFEQTGELVDQPEAQDAEISVTKEVANNDDASCLYECPVCHEDYIDPKILPCGHLVCQKCVLSWVNKEGPQATCPLCRARIVSLTPPQMASADLASEVNALPTDLYTAVLVESHQVLEGPHICSMCENDVSAMSYCIPCGVKLCAGCVRNHKKIPATQMHSPESFDSLTLEKLVETRPVMCKTHPDRLAELYCPEHQEVICFLCGNTSHGSCADKKMADMEKDTKAELVQQVQKLKLKEAKLTNQIKNAKYHFRILRKRVNDKFDDLQQTLDTHRQHFNRNIQAEENIVLKSLAALDRTRGTLTQNTSTIGNLVQSVSGAALLQMVKDLKVRLDHLEKQAEDAKEPNPAEFVRDLQKLDDLKKVIAALAATFSYTVENVSQLRETVMSPPCMIRNLPWKILLNQHQNTKGQKSLGVFLECNGESQCENAAFVLRKTKEMGVLQLFVLGCPVKRDKKRYLEDDSACVPASTRYRWKKIRENQGPHQTVGHSSSSTGPCVEVEIDNADFSDNQEDETINSSSSDASFDSEDSDDADIHDSNSTQSGCSSSTEEDISVQDSETQPQAADSPALSLLSCFLRHNMSASASKDVIDTFKSICPDSDTIQQMNYDEMWKSVSSFSGALQEFHYCPLCSELFPEDPDIVSCTKEGCDGLRYKGTDQTKNGRQPRHKFVFSDMKSQLKLLLESPGIWQNIQETKQTIRRKKADGDPNIGDITDGAAYRKMCEEGEFLAAATNLSVVMNTDGINLYSSSKVELWPIFLAINELNPAARFARENLLLAGIWQGKGKPPFQQYLSLFAKEMNDLKQNGVDICVNNRTKCMFNLYNIIFAFLKVNFQLVSLHVLEMINVCSIYMKWWLMDFYIIPYRYFLWTPRGQLISDLKQPSMWLAQWLCNYIAT